MEKDGSLLSSLLGTGSFTATGQIVSFTGVIVYARLSTPTTLGEYFLLVSVVSVLAFLGTAGVTTHVTRSVSRKTNQGQNVGSGLVVVLTAAGLVIVGVSIATPLLGPFLGHSPGWIIIALVPAMAGQLGSAVLRGEERPVSAEAIETGRKISTYMIGCGLVLMGVSSFHSFASGYVIGLLLETIATIMFSNVTLTTPALTDVVSFLKETKYLYVSRLSGIGFEWIDTLLLGILVGPAAVAAYEIVWRISGVANVATNAVVSVYYPRFTALVANGVQEDLADYSQQAYYYASVMVLPLLGGGLVIGSDIISVTFGDVYKYAASALVVLLGGRLAYGIGRISTILLYSHADDRGVAKAEIIAVSTNIVFNLLLIPVIGLKGAALATSASYFVASIIKTILVYRRYDLLPPAGRLFRAGIATVVMIGVLLVVPTVSEVSNRIVIAQILLGALVFLGTVMAIDHKTRMALSSIYR